MSGPDTPEHSPPPQPPVPKAPMDPTFGEETALVTAAPTSAHHETTWLESILATQIDLDSNHPLHLLRASSNQQISSLPVPSRRQESWRFTDLSTIYASRYTPPTPPDQEQLEALDVRRYAPDTAGIVLVFVDGVFDPVHSILNDDSGKEWMEAGGYFGPFSSYKGDSDPVRDVLSRKELGSEEGGLFPTIGNAIASDAVVLDVPSDFSVSRPVALLFVSTGGTSAERATASSSRVAVLARPGSKITLLESHASLDETGFSVALAGAGIDVQPNASVKHYLVNNCGEDAHLLSNVHATVREGGNYEVRPVGLGGKVGRFTIGIDLIGSGGHGQIHGALMATGLQVSDIHSRICHDAPHCTSNQLQKNIASDRGRAIFNGKVIVTEEGAQTDSEQLCRSLLLSNKAAIDAMPVLEIATDDVKCTHGATVSDIEPDELFYCQTRGLSLQDAQLLVVTGFALDIVGDCPFPTVGEQVSRKVEQIAATSMERERNKAALSSI